MQYKKKSGVILFLLICVFVLIIDSKTALAGARDGFEICIKTVIPSLLPFIVLTSYLNAHLAGTNICWLKPLDRFIGIPVGAESALLLGFLGGYPAGAQNVYQLYNSDCISRQSARRMLGFCNNAGPSFIFGMTSILFTNAVTPWLLWLIQILSAIIVGSLLPDKEQAVCRASRCNAISMPTAVENGTKIITVICGWVILFRILVTFLQNWFLWMFSREIQIAVIGFFELANGCYELQQIPNEGLRFILCSGILSFGGISVVMQTRSVCGKLGTGSYLFGKVLQCAICVIASYVLQFFLFPQPYSSSAMLIISIAISFVILCTVRIQNKAKKFIAIPA